MQKYKEKSIYKKKYARVDRQPSSAASKDASKPHSHPSHRALS